MKYLIRVDYVCDKVEMGGRWFALETDNEPQLRVINKEPFAGGPLLNHGCKRLYYSDNCDMDETCNW